MIFLGDFLRKNYLMIAFREFFTNQFKILEQNNKQTFESLLTRTNVCIILIISKAKDPSSNGAPTPSDRSYTYTQILTING